MEVCLASMGQGAVGIPFGFCGQRYVFAEFFDRNTAA